jgi:hypothetical protein
VGALSAILKSIEDVVALIATVVSGCLVLGKKIAMLKDAVATHIKKRFRPLVNPRTIVHFVLIHVH